MRHEQTAAHAADGYARQTGRLGCVVTTAGPGCTNAVTGVATAMRSESPVLHICGQSSLTQHRMGSLQDLPHVELMSSVTKFASGVYSTERIPDMISMAARECFAGAPGPALLEIPRDVLDAEIPVESVHLPAKGSNRASARSMGDPGSVESLATILETAERPAVLFGQQVWMSGSHDACISFVRSFDIPAYLNGAARGMMRQADPHHFDRTRSFAFKEADLVLIVGTPFDFRMGYGNRILAPKVVQIDLDYRTVGKNREIFLGLCGHPGTILSQVSQCTTIRKDVRQKRLAWMKQLRRLEEQKLEQLMPIFTSDRSPIHPYRLAWEIDKFLDDGTIYIGDGGDVVTISAQAVRPRNPGQWMDPGALGSLGVGTGFALAAGLAHPNKEVICLYGDGSFGMTAFDMETAQRFGAPFLAIIGNNSSMNQIRCGQIAKYGSQRGNVGNALGDVEFSKFAQLLGGYGEEVRDADQIRPALDRARNAIAKSGRCAVINVWIDPDEYAPGTKSQTMYK